MENAHTLATLAGPKPASGYQKRKKQKEKKKKFQATLKHISTLDKLFARKSIESANINVSNLIHLEDDSVQNVDDVGTNKRASENDGIEHPECEIQSLSMNNNNDEDNSTSPRSDLDLDYYSDPAKWEDLNDKKIDFLIRTLPLFPVQEFLKLNISNSKNVYTVKVKTKKKNKDIDNENQKCKSFNRFISENLFYTKMKSSPDQQVRREWLRYSESSGCIFCVPCKLCSKQGQNVFTSGFKDWKHPGRIREHETSFLHRQNTKVLILRENILGKIDSALHKQYDDECQYWRKVLYRVFDIVKFLSSRGLSFRGTDGKFGSLTNGNYMGLFELLAEYDPFLKVHIETHSGKGRGSVSYLSKTTLDEFLELLRKNLTKKIIEGVKLNKYYSISVDSTPDIRNIDQLVFILRYMTEDGDPVERFIKFIPMSNHKASTIERIVMGKLYLFRCTHFKLKYFKF